MSYSRWLGSDWYSFRTRKKRLELWHRDHSDRCYGVSVEQAQRLHESGDFSDVTGFDECYRDELAETVAMFLADCEDMTAQALADWIVAGANAHAKLFDEAKWHSCYDEDPIPHDTWEEQLDRYIATEGQKGESLEDAARRLAPVVITAYTWDEDFEEGEEHDAPQVKAIASYTFGWGEILQYMEPKP